MMCRKCGAAIPAGAEKCPKCGAPAPQRRPERKSVSRAADPKLAAKIPFFLMALALMHILEIVFWFLNAVTITESDILVGKASMYTVFSRLSEFSGFFVYQLLTVAVCVLAACAVLLALLPLIQGGRGRRMRMPVSKVAVIVHAGSMGLILYALFTVGNEVGSKPAITFGGVLQLVLCVAIFVLTMVISKASKQKKVDRI